MKKRYRVMALPPIAFAAIPACGLLGAALGIALVRVLGAPDVLGAQGILLGLVVALAAAVTTVHVEEDGFRVRGVFRNEVVRWADVVNIEVVAAKDPLGVGVTFRQRVEVRLQNGRLVDVDHDVRFGREAGAELYRALTQAHAAYVRRDAGAVRPTMANLRRRSGARGLRDALHRGETGFREATLDADHLWPIVEDPTADPRDRAAAAVALSGSLDEVGRVRIRDAEEKTALPRLRIAFEAARKDAPDSELDARLEELEIAAEEAPGRVKRSARG